MGQVEQIGIEISWSRPRSDFMIYFIVSVEKCLDKKAKNWYNITMKNITKNHTHTRSNVFKLDIFDGVNHVNEYVFARTLKSAKSITARKFSHKNVLGIERCEIYRG